MKTGILSYGTGNVFTLEKKLRKIGADYIVIESYNDLIKVDKIILPGVGHFGHTVRWLKANRIWEPLSKMLLDNGVPVLGICLGMQLLCKFSEEGNVNGLGMVDSIVKKFRIKNWKRYKVPHIAWNKITVKGNSVLMKGIESNQEFYFVHSYHLASLNEEIDAYGITNYEYDFVSLIEKNNIFGVQFHPEKSFEQGEMILKNFVNV